MTNTFQHTAHFYDIDQHPAHNDDIPFYLHQASQFGSPILELGCGTGRIAIPLAQEGFSVYGLDLSQEMLSIFEQKRQNLPHEAYERITIAQKAMTDFSLGTTFQLILIPFHSFQALPSDEAARNCLNCIYDHLDEDGAFILNVSHLGDGFAEYWQTGLETQESIEFLEDGQFVTRYTILQELDQRQRLMTFDNLYRVSGMETEAEEYRDRLQVRYYGEDDLRHLLNEAGFEITNEMGWYDGTPVSDGDEFIFVCRKKGEKTN
ncbi:class I SAM-dependent methyltransferase [Tuberibacillus sp. Marseille-P3662]|uniref:class I SAM-dependent methyltransferase n=1 Tax=Tuberibacillus sp. Marseille-P3662 TaxID=1965358 RepID=UPI001593C2E1|nr:class I SAM-dependent methyltransferase [Tuberibacillus sp. Marseille-P3662]